MKHWIWGNNNDGTGNGKPLREKLYIYIIELILRYINVYVASFHETLDLG